MKKVFIAPEVQVLFIEKQDIVTLSMGKKAGDNDMIVDLDNL